MNAHDPHWPDEQVHAYVDGELDAARAARLEADLARDAALAARVERQRQVRALLRERFDAVLAEPVPARLHQAAAAGAGGVVTPIGAARTGRVARAPLWWGALAASVLIGVMLGWNLPRESGLPFTRGADGLLARGELDEALTQRLSSDGTGSSVISIALSFQDNDGRYCRSFSLAGGVDGLACRGDAGWQVEVIGQSASPGTAGDYRQAASPLSRTVLDAISARQSGDVLAAGEEARLRASGWRKAPTPPAP